MKKHKTEDHPHGGFSARADTESIIRVAAATALKRGDFSTAEKHYQAILRRVPQDFDALHMLAVVMIQTGRAEHGRSLLVGALRINPAHAPAWANLGNAHMYLNQASDALRAYDQALVLAPQFVGALINRGTVLQNLGRHDQAAADFECALTLAPKADFLPGSFFQSRRYGCDWRDFGDLRARICSAVASACRVDQPFSFLSVSDDASQQLQCARTHGQIHAGHRPLWNGERYGHRRIRVAYLCSHFGSHIVSNLMAPIYEHHARDTFETIGVSLAPWDRGEMLPRLRRAVEEFVDASGMSDHEAAQWLRKREVDIAVDLTGYTQGSRPGILARRPAPVNVNYLGYPGTLGVAGMDYIIADQFVIPEQSRRFYAEQVVYLPDTFQANGPRESLLTECRRPTRREAGLPDSGTVLCCFNNGYKMNPAIFNIWMTVLRTVSDSVLWMLAETDSARQRLRHEAALRGIHADRLVFAPRVSYSRHLARLQLADLFLDTLPFTAGATAGDALWSGVPIITCAGEAFASRMGGSLLRAIGLTDLITFSADEYERRAIELAGDGARLAAIKARLHASRDASPLFDAKRHCRHLEAAYAVMWARAERGEAPAGFAVPGDC